MRSRAPEASNDTNRPEVIVDFISQDGLLFITLKNIGARSAYRVTTRFDKPFRGLEGRKCISEMQLFKRLEFMPPGKEFAQFIDTIDTFFRRREPHKVTATIAYTDRARRRFKDVITHDLRIFRELGHIRRLG